MKLDLKLKQMNMEEIWDDYCGFLDLSMEDFMMIQNRLMEEQLELWSSCELGKTMLSTKTNHEIKTLDDFRRYFPLTTYEDYADVLLLKKGDMLPDDPIVWIQTTWEGGRHPIKLAPYSKSMLETYRNNVVACLLLATSKEKGHFNVNTGDTMLYGLAPLPYATGLLPLLLDEEITLSFLPPVKEAQEMSFSGRNKLGFKMGMKKGIDLFFAVGSVTYYISKSFSEMASKKSSSSSGKMNLSPMVVARYLKAKAVCKRENRELMPKDMFDLKGFMCAGTDNRCYKDDLEKLWGIRPVEVFAGTEPGCMGCETWSRNGLYFFPDACFYEFIPFSELRKNMEDPEYKPSTCLIDEVTPGQMYELVISVLKGGAFMRYRVGDVYRCLGIGSNEDKTSLPRFEYVDRVPDVIDIAGFTRITENSINTVITLSGLETVSWFACKEFNEDNRPYMHLYVEIAAASIHTRALSTDLLRQLLSVHFKYLDNDYQDLKKILGIDPLEITILPSGTYAQYEKTGRPLPRKINPEAAEKLRFLEFCGLPYIAGNY